MQRLDDEEILNRKDDRALGACENIHFARRFTVPRGRLGCAINVRDPNECGRG